jgi:predicted XRE-type DNA-binding protein
VKKIFLRIYIIGGTFTGGDFLETKIPRNVNDLIQKGMMNLFQDQAITFFGFTAPKIVESLNVELQDIKIEERRTDLVFLLEDNSLLHLEFQTIYNANDVTRFILYDVLLHEQHKKRKVTTVIIYAAGVKPRNVSLSFKTLDYHPYTIFLEEKDGDAILEALEEKVATGTALDVEEIINLDFNYFMKSDIINEERAQRLMNVANHITQRKSRELAIASIYGIASKFLTPIQMEKLSEVFMMIDPFDQLVNKRMEEKIKQMADPFKAKIIEMAKILLDKDISVDIISEVTNLEPDTILELSQQI